MKEWRMDIFMEQGEKFIQTYDIFVKLEESTISSIRSKYCSYLSSLIDINEDIAERGCIINVLHRQKIVASESKKDMSSFISTKDSTKITEQDLALLLGFIPISNELQCQDISTLSDEEKQYIDIQELNNDKLAKVMFQKHLLSIFEEQSLAQGLISLSPTK
mmetsp:Transcript_3122/g.3724  ORF Transcript_3122/g.3724 Transcript_3122/m.3724 type:complete len:162 (+) Transcript_3122:212-697(+)